jgi:tetratricopeptide (TPR) repeat protein
MNRMLILAIAAVAAAGCAEIRQLSHRDEDPYARPFYAKYLNTGSTLDAEIQRTLGALRENPASAALHNELGAMLVQKGFPKDAAREFERAIDSDGRYVPAWYNLGLVRATNGDDLGARRAFQKTIRLKPGHSAALFQLGLIEEKRFHVDRAVELYAKAFSINPSLLEVEVNPRILDSSLVDLALLRMYRTDHAKKSMQFQDAPLLDGVTGTPTPAAPGTADAPSPQPPPQTIVTPAAPPTDPGAQNNALPPRQRRPRVPETNQPNPTAPPVPPPV